jgi:uncharacterized protein (TIGR00299 family) protein
MSATPQIAYFDCFSGASGDMILGALVDAGLALDDLRQGLAGLPLTGEYTLTAETVQRGALRATQVRVETSDAHSHRHLSDIVAIIEAGDLSQTVKEKSQAIFRRLAEAEARVHATSIEHVHFHEVGAVDAIVDIVGAVFGLERLGVAQVYASPLPLGGGQVEASHGTLPLPAPATLELLALAGAPTRPWPADVELVTPTGAAILTTLAQFRQPPMRVARVGYGTGRKEFTWPNVLRLWLGEPLGPGRVPATTLKVLETNIDDMNPELYGHVMARLFDAGALDVYLTPIYMKKNRPATMLSVMVRDEDEAALAEVMLRETSTLGVRVRSFYRYEAGREVRQVETAYGPLQVKLKRLDGRVVGVAPEYESCRRVAGERAVPLAEVYRAAQQAGGTLLNL